MKNEDVILGPKANTLEKHVGKTRRHATLGQEIKRMVCPRNAIMQRMKLFIFKKTTSQLPNEFKEGLRGSGVENGNSLLQFYTYYNKPNPCLRLRF